MGGNNGFTVDSPGYYKIAIRYQWYWNNAVEHSQFEWAGVHNQFFSKTAGSLSWNWSGASGDYCYMP